MVLANIKWTSSPALPARLSDVPYSQRRLYCDERRSGGFLAGSRHYSAVLAAKGARHVRDSSLSFAKLFLRTGSAVAEMQLGSAT